MAVAGSSSDHGPQELRKLPADAVPIFGPDPPYPCLFFLTRDEAQALAKRGKVTFKRKTKHIRGFIIVPEILREAQKPTSIRGASMGDPTSRDSVDNPTGCWSYEVPVYRNLNGEWRREPATSKTYCALPKWAGEILFRTILLECTTHRRAA